MLICWEPEAVSSTAWLMFTTLRLISSATADCSSAALAIWVFMSVMRATAPVMLFRD